jgi:hypothetical protein
MPLVWAESLYKQCILSGGVSSDGNHDDRSLQLGVKHRCHVNVPVNDGRHFALRNDWLLYIVVFPRLVVFVVFCFPETSNLTLERVRVVFEHGFRGRYARKWRKQYRR